MKVLLVRIGEVEEITEAIAVRLDLIRTSLSALIDEIRRTDCEWSWLKDPFDELCECLVAIPRHEVRRATDVARAIPLHIRAVGYLRAAIAELSERERDAVNTRLILGGGCYRQLCFVLECLNEPASRE